jgi:SAM-dependent methyltransferase
LSTILTIGTDEVDLDTLPPMNVGMRRGLFAQSKVDYCLKFNAIGDFHYVLFMLRQIRPQTTEAEVDALPLPSVNEVLQAELRITKEHFNPAEDTFTTGDSETGFIPAIGQPGKNVIWWPTPRAVVNRMLDMAELGPEDTLIDLGSGDGRIVIEAARRGAEAIGYEANPDLVSMARKAAVSANVPASFVHDDLFNADLSSATVISMYLLPDLNLRLRPALFKLKRGTRIVSHGFDMGNWRPNKTYIVGAKTAHLWIV